MRRWYAPTSGASSTAHTIPRASRPRRSISLTSRVRQCRCPKRRARCHSRHATRAGWRCSVSARQASGRADAAAFISASQPYAGIFLDAIPGAYDMRIPSGVFQLIVQRRLRMPLSVLANVTYSRTLGSTWRQAAERLQPHHPPRGAAQAMGRCHPRCPRSLGCRARADEIQRVLPRRAARCRAQECATRRGKHVIYEQKVGWRAPSARRPRARRRRARRRLSPTPRTRCVHTSTTPTTTLRALATPLCRSLWNRILW